jgi:putative LysE/RhtB family amino acid efflux pump
MIPFHRFLIGTAMRPHQGARRGGFEPAAARAVRAVAGMAGLGSGAGRSRASASGAPAEGSRAGRRCRYGGAMTPLVVGFGLGFLVAAQLGPISLLAIRSTLRGGLTVGLAIGGAVAVIDTLYAAAGAAGAAGLLAIEPLRLAFGLLGAAVLAVLGARTLWSAFRIRNGGEAREELATPRAAFLTALAATASNPLTIASWAAVFAAASTAGAVAAGASGAVLLLAGVGLGSLTWMSMLAAGVAVARRRVGPRLLRAVDGVAGAGILGFGGLLAYRTLRD